MALLKDNAFLVFALLVSFVLGAEHCYDEQQKTERARIEATRPVCPPAGSPGP